MAVAFVTGASGFVGSNLVEVLTAQGHQVRCLVRKTSAVDVLRGTGAELVYGDIDQPEKLREHLHGVDVVYHSAGLTCALNMQHLLTVNRDGTRNVLEACAAQAKPPVVVHISSIAASGPVGRGQIRTEVDPPAPVSQYGESKLAAEKVALELGGQVPITIVRPGIVFGPRDRGQYAIFKTIRMLRVHPVPGFHQPPLSFIHVADLAEMLIRAAERGQRLPGPDATRLDGHQPGIGIYFAVAPEHPTLADWGKMARPLLRRPFAPVLPMPNPLPWFFASCSEMLSQIRGRADLFNLDKIRESQVDSWACSPHAAQRDLGFTPSEPLHQRLVETIEWYKQAGWLRK